MNSRMTTASPISRALAALGHDVRLSIYRLLVKAGTEGLSIGDVIEHLDIAPSTLAHHLSTLVDAGLVTQEKQGRTVINRVDYDVMHSTVDFLTAECCSGVTLSKTCKVA
jgi:ArsR family transcriptional regulator, arsenate/arsenite/antimonite-responsive transcriptional repressor